MSKNKNNTLKPGQKSPINEVYDEIPKGKKNVDVDKGDKMPPTSKPGNKWKPKNK